MAADQVMRKEAMTSQLERLEQTLGGKLERQGARVIPGTVAVEGTEFVYFADDGEYKFRKKFRNLTEFTNPPNAKSGGVNERGCKIHVSIVLRRKRRHPSRLLVRRLTSKNTQSIL